MKVLKRRMLLPLLGSILAGMTACGTARSDAKISAVENSAAATASETVTQSSNKASPQISPSESVKVRAAETSVKAGESAEAIVEVIVADGYHINGNPPSNNYLRPTELKFEKDANITIGKFIYPNAAMKKFDFADAPISVYQDTFLIKFPIRAVKNAKIGRTVLRGTLQAQPCNDNACFPTRSLEFSLPIQITR